LGKSFFDIIILDGLYKYSNINQLYHITGSHILVKTKEKSLDIIQNAEMLFDNKDILDPSGNSIKFCSDFDTSRMEYYKIWEVDDIVHSEKNNSLAFKVARVEEYKAKRVNGKLVNTSELKEVYWVVTTKKDLSGKLLRQLAITRWMIENNGFKQMNLFAKTKRLYSHFMEIALYLVLLFILAHNLFLLFLSIFSKNKWSAKEVMKKPLKYFYIVLAENTFIVGGREPPSLISV